VKLDISKVMSANAGELTPEQVEAALREAKRPKGTACGTISAAALTSESEPKRLLAPSAGYNSFDEDDGA